MDLDEHSYERLKKDNDRNNQEFWTLKVLFVQNYLSSFKSCATQYREFFSVHLQV